MSLTLPAKSDETRPRSSKSPKGSDIPKEENRKKSRAKSNSPPRNRSKSRPSRDTTTTTQGSRKYSGGSKKMRSMSGPSKKNSKEQCKASNVSKKKVMQPRMPCNRKFDAMKKDQLQANESYRKRFENPSNEGIKFIDVEPSPKGGGEDCTGGKMEENDNVAKPNTSQSVVVSQQQASPGGAIVGENLQNVAEHGEYLLDFPTFSVSMSFVELFLALCGITLALMATKAHIGASYMLIFNTVLIVLLLGGLIPILWMALHVREEKDLNEQLRYFIAPRARRYMAGIHLLRLMLLGSTLSILIYFAVCGDHALEIRQVGVCQTSPLSRAFLGVSAALFSIQLLIVMCHLIFYFQNKLSVRSPFK